MDGLFPLARPLIGAGAAFLILALASVAGYTAHEPAQPEVRVDTSSKSVDLAPSTWLLEDAEGRLTFADVHSPANEARFHPGSSKIGTTTSTFWLRYRVRSQATQPMTRWFDSGNRRLQEIDLFTPTGDGGFVRQSASSAKPFADRPLPYPSFIFPIVLAPDATSDIYLRIRTTGFSNLEVFPKVWQPQAYASRTDGEKEQWLLYIGMATALGLFNLLIFVAIRDRIYLLYVASLVSIVWAVSSARGGFGVAFEYVWPDSPVFEQVAWIASMIPAVFFNLLFLRKFVGLQASMPRLDVYLNICVTLVIALNFSLVVMTALQEPGLAHTMQRVLLISSLVMLAMMAGGLVGLLLLARAGKRSAQILSIAWTPFLLAALYSVSTTALGTPGTPALVAFASAFELVLMSLALADRFNQERKAKIQAQDEKTQAQAALVIALQQSERELEDKVAQRTAEVRSQAAEIAQWNSKLEQRVHDQVAQIERLGRLKRFFSPQLAEVIVAGGEEALKTHRREISVVFIDLRGFTAFADHAEPEEVIEMLRSFHGSMGRIVLEHGGTLERFAGDSVMVFFNDPLPMERHAEQAVRMAVAMREAFKALSLDWDKRGFVLGLGCGIAKGYATLGEIGFEGRWDYAAIGGVTNLAARLCAEAVAGQILVDRKMMHNIETIVEAIPIGPLELKGFLHSTQAFAITSIRVPT